MLEKVFSAKIDNCIDLIKSFETLIKKLCETQSLTFPAKNFDKLDLQMPHFAKILSLT